MTVRPLITAVHLCIVLSVQASGQSASPRFEVASVKRAQNPDPSSGTGIARPLPGGRFTANDAFLKTLVQFAYNVRRYQILGGPDWSDSARFDIEAAPEAGAAGTPRQVAAMLQSLLE
jgi:uncharacterized protein (TIGR03435 family)